jgi:hypothetical protein
MNASGHNVGGVDLRRRILGTLEITEAGGRRGLTKSDAMEWLMAISFLSTQRRMLFNRPRDDQIRQRSEVILASFVEKWKLF